MVGEKLTKAVDAVSINEFEITTDFIVSGTSLTFSKCVRDDAVTVSVNPGNRANYFSSFNLPTSDLQISTASTLSLLYPELYQLNTDKFILIILPKTGHTEYIDGRSVKLTIQYFDTSTSSQTTKVLYSSTYSGDKASKEGESSPFLGDNIAYLFSDSFNRPYSGLTINEIGDVVSRSAITSWNPTGQYKDRPGAISFKEVQRELSCLNSDRRRVVDYSTYVRPAYPSFIGESIYFYSAQNNGGFVELLTESTHSFNAGDAITIEFGSLARLYNTASTITSKTANSILTSIVWSSNYSNKSGGIYKGAQGVYCNYDLPLGFVSLDKGFIVITHKDIVDNFMFSTGTDGFFSNGVLVNGLFNVNLENIYFTGGTLFNASYTSINKEYTTAISCNALLNEFYISNNSTWDRAIALNPMGAPSPVQITEAGFYNALGELIGISKFSEPVQKTQNDIISFDFYINM